MVSRIFITFLLVGVLFISACTSSEKSLEQEANYTIGEETKLEIRFTGIHWIDFPKGKITLIDRNETLSLTINSWSYTVKELERLYPQQKVDVITGERIRIEVEPFYSSYIHEGYLPRQELFELTITGPTSITISYDEDMSVYDLKESDNISGRADQGRALETCEEITLRRYINMNKEIVEVNISPTNDDTCILEYQRNGTYTRCEYSNDRREMLADVLINGIWSKDYWINETFRTGDPSGIIHEESCVDIQY